MQVALTIVHCLPIVKDTWHSHLNLPHVGRTVQVIVVPKATSPPDTFDGPRIIMNGPTINIGTQ
jgi:hypothetical protein